MYSFDPVGSYEREACRAAGAAQSLVQPFLDNQVSNSTYPSFCSPWHPRWVCADADVDADPHAHAQIYFKNQKAAPGTAHPAHLPLPDVLSIVIDSFTSATERHIEVRLRFLFGFFACSFRVLFVFFSVILVFFFAVVRPLPSISSLRTFVFSSLFFGVF